MSQLGNLSPSLIVTDIRKVIPDTGDDVTPNVAGEVNLAGGDNINTVGVAATNTITVNLDKSISQPNTNGTATEGMYSLGGTRFMHNYGTNNTFIGKEAGNTTLTVINATNNTAVGSGSLRNVTTGNSNTSVGYSSGLAITQGDANTSIGFGSSLVLTTGDLNTSVGFGSLNQLQTGSSNVCIGSSAGINYTGAESNNIIIGSGLSGTLGESNVTRIGASQNACYIDGITGVNPSGTIEVVTINGSDQLGSTAALSITTGFESWDAAGPYFDDTTLGDFTLLVGGTGYINSKPVSWTAPQTVSGMVAGNTYWIYIDSTGTIGKTSSVSASLFQDNIILFECLRDSTPVTNNQITVKENHPYTMSITTSGYAHNVIGNVIENNNMGANIVLNGTQKIQINGADVLSDHGLYTTIPDSGGVGVTWRKMYTNAGGKWATHNVSDTFTGFYNNAGTPTALGVNKFGVYRLYVSKDTISSTTPSYFAVLHTAEFNSLAASNTAIGNGSIARTTGELASLELAQLGYIVYSQLANAIVNVVIEKATLRQTLSTAGTSTASLVNTVTTNFDGILSSADTNVQAALETIDDWGKWSVVTVDAGLTVNTGTIADKVGLLTMTLPTTASIGDLLEFTNINTAVGLRIAQNANQQIRISGSTSTLGAGGYVETTQLGDSLKLLCTVAGASTRWTALSLTGNWTIA